MIITHGNFAILEKLIRFFDHEDSDIYIHLDAKVRDFDFAHYTALTEKASVTFTEERYTVHWGDVSIVRAEYALLRAAGKGHYDYYHLLSGADAPLKSYSCIDRYFEERAGRNFLCFQNPEISREHLERVRFYYPFQNRDFKNKFVRYGLKALSLFPQRLVGVDRVRKLKDTVFQKGTQWVSITDDFAQYVLSKEEWALRVFDRTYCSDELLMHTLIMNSPFRDTLPPKPYHDKHRSCCRYIDWERGHPYTFRDGDLEELLHTDEDYLFARKFDYKTAPGVVDALFDHFGE